MTPWVMPLVMRMLLTAMLFTASVSARINVVTLPQRDSVQLTIYNSADLTLVKETRYITFRKGMNRLEFSWANTLIDPTSVEFHALTHAAQVEVRDVSFPPRVTNLLEWRIQSEFAGEVKVEIRYFTSGISWAADYVVEADKLEKKMELAGAVTVSNRSGEDYENAQVRLVVGVIHLVEDIVDLARRGRPVPRPLDRKLDAMEAMPTSPSGGAGGFVGMMKEAEARPKEIIKEGLSEYFLYTVEGRDTIPNGWSKRLPSFRIKDVPIVSYYKYERECASEPQESEHTGGSGQTVTLNLRDVPLLNAIKFLTTVSGLKYRVESDAVRIVRGDVQLQSTTRTFPIQHSVLDALLGKRGDLRLAFRDFGVEFPSGTSISHNKSLGILVVSHAEDVLDHIEDVLRRLGAGGEVRRLSTSPPSKPGYTADPAMMKRLESIHIPRIEFENTPIISAIHFLISESRAHDPQRRGINIIPAFSGDGGSVALEQAAPVTRFYRFKNDKESHLGREPLPDGSVMAFRLVTPDKLCAFVGSTEVKYIPINEQVELDLGEDLEVMVRPVLMNWVKDDIRFDNDGNVAGWTIKETWEIEVQNSKPIDVVVDIRRNFAGDWSVFTNDKYEKVDATKIKFVLSLKPHEKQKITYEVSTRHGTNVKK